MLIAPDIDPVAIQIGPLKIHWYGLMYVIGITGGWAYGVYRASRPDSGWQKEQVSDLLFYLVIGVIAGGRLGYVLFYNPLYYLQHPLEIFYVWTGGMSFHGGLIGVLLAMWWYARKSGRPWFDVMDFIAVLSPIGLGVGRLGNFINQELWGKVTDLPWGMVFKTGGPLPRHPTQLYEAFLEGVVLFIVMWLFTRRPRPTAAASGLFAIGYGSFRFVVEFVRQPDAHLGYLAFGWFTMGQALSLPLILTGVGFMIYAYRARHSRTS
jgi:phosphatidylglycerol---prolipoprotein diacylglyceryl transferase